MAGNGNGASSHEARINPEDVKANAQKLDDAGIIENLRIDDSGGLAFYFEVPALRKADNRGDFTFDEVQMASFLLGAFAERSFIE